MTTVSYYVSCPKFTVAVDIDATRTIRNAAPIVRKFIGQPFDNLIRWANSLGDTKVVQLNVKKESAMTTGLYRTPVSYDYVAKTVRDITAEQMQDWIGQLREEWKQGNRTVIEVVQLIADALLDLYDEQLADQADALLDEYHQQHVKSAEGTLAPEPDPELWDIDDLVS